MKLIYVMCAFATVYLIYVKFKATYDSNHDSFRIEFLIVPVGVWPSSSTTISLL